MKIPNKIYLDTITRDDDLSKSWFEEPYDNNNANLGITSIEYICKDTLMELINKLRTIPHDNAIIRDNTFQEIINLINTL